MKFSNLKLPSNRKFGFFFAAVFALLFCYYLIYGVHYIAWVFGTSSIIFFIVALVKSEVLFPLNMLWMRFGLLLGMIVSPIVLGAIFFIVFTPIAILMRIFGRDELKLIPKSAASYWKVRDPNSLSDDSFKHQF